MVCDLSLLGVFQTFTCSTANAMVCDWYLRFFVPVTMDLDSGGCPQLMT